jgi:peroxiredoxin Q/BCP
MVEEGRPAPTFTLPSDAGENVSLESFRGQPVVLYFYPKDDAPAHISPIRPCPGSQRAG